MQFIVIRIAYEGFACDRFCSPVSLGIDLLNKNYLLYILYIILIAFDPEISTCTFLSKNHEQPDS